MNNKPVAWMLVDEINGDYMLERQPSGDYDWIPLYTYPVKELKLTNDEIREIGDECIFNNNGILNWIEFAKAILRKAREK